MNVDYWRHRLARHMPTLLAALILLGASLLYFFTPGWLSSDLASNLLAEGIGIFITVGIVQWLIDRWERRRTLPARFSAYQQANWLLYDIAGTWVAMVRSTVLVPPPIGEDLLTQKYLEEVVGNFDAEADAGVLPSSKWWEELSRVAGEWAKMIDRIIVRHQVAMAPEFLDVLLGIEQSPTLRFWRNYKNLAPTLATVSKPLSQLIILESFVQDEGGKLRRLHGILSEMAKEFRGLSGFREPYDITFKTAIQEMHDRDDIAPKRGSARRATAGAFIPFGASLPKMEGSVPKD